MQASAHSTVSRGVNRTGISSRTRVSVLHGPEGRAHSPQPRSGSGDAHRDRASQLQHTVERIGSDLHLGRTALVLVRAQPVPDHLLPSGNTRLDTSAPVIA